METGLIGEALNSLSSLIEEYTSLENQGLNPPEPVSRLTIAT